MMNSKLSKAMAAAVALMAVPFAAQAADVPVKGYYKAPPRSVVSYYNWTGFYAGINGGYGFGPRHLDFHPTRDWIYVSLERQDQIAFFPRSGGRLTDDAVSRVDAALGRVLARRGIAPKHTGEAIEAAAVRSGSAISPPARTAITTCTANAAITPSHTHRCLKRVASTSVAMRCCSDHLSAF